MHMARVLYVKKSGAKSQRLAPNLEELKHRLMWIESMIKSMPSGVDRDEAIAMVERCAEALWNE